MDDSIEIPTRCSFVTEFIIPKFIEGSTFRASHRSSSGALNCVCSLWFIYPYGDRPLQLNYSLTFGTFVCVMIIMLGAY
jgi:hypothetical protein